ncbi:protein phosphatase [Pelomyxa schiedti]|nr:protein phosphatase [Pelomyxa schiedti]
MDSRSVCTAASSAATGTTISPQSATATTTTTHAATSWTRAQPTPATSPDQQQPAQRPKTPEQPQVVVAEARTLSATHTPPSPSTPTTPATATATATATASPAKTAPTAPGSTSTAAAATGEPLAPPGGVDSSEAGGGPARGVVAAVGSASVRGICNYQEDRVINTKLILSTPGGSIPADFIAVYDGHGGAEAADYCVKRLHFVLVRKLTQALGGKPPRLPKFEEDEDWEYDEDEDEGETEPTDPGKITEMTHELVMKALTDTFVAVEIKFLEKLYDSGCTALCVLVINGFVYVANAGDCRCIIVSLNSSGASEACVVKQLSQDHKPTLPEERKRIENAGSSIEYEAIIVGGKRVKLARIDGRIACSRSIGDSDFKETPGSPDNTMSCFPDISVHKIQSNDRFLCLGCDGVYDFLENDEIGAFIMRHLPQSPLSDKQLADVALRLVNHIVNDREGTDNTSAVIVALE